MLMITKILLFVAAAVAVVLIVALFQPSTYRVTRSAVIKAPAARVYGEIVDFHHWLAWSPWEKLDPSMKRTIEGQASGVGAVYAWEGDGKVGAGRMTITEARPAEAIRIKLEFYKPMAGVCPTDFDLREQGGQTTLTWTMSGENNYLAKVMCLFMNMDKMIGGDFEKGLANLKQGAEQGK